MGLRGQSYWEDRQGAKAILVFQIYFYASDPRGSLDPTELLGNPTRPFGDPKGPYGDPAPGSYYRGGRLLPETISPRMETGVPEDPLNLVKIKNRFGSLQTNPHADAWASRH